MEAGGGEELAGRGTVALEGAARGRSGRLGRRPEEDKQGLDTVAQRGLTWLHLGAGLGGASGQRKPEGWGAETGLHALHREWGFEASGSPSTAPTGSFFLSETALATVTTQLRKAGAPPGVCLSPWALAW